MTPAEAASHLRRMGRNAQANSLTARKGIKMARGYRSKWEEEYAKVLEMQRATGSIDGWVYEGVKLKLPGGTIFTPDFLRWTSTHPDAPVEGETTCPYYLMAIEIKGHRREAAMVRFREARAAFPFIKFVMLTKANGSWMEMDV